VRLADGLINIVLLHFVAIVMPAVLVTAYKPVRYKGNSGLNFCINGEIFFKIKSSSNSSFPHKSYAECMGLRTQFICFRNMH
jgi:hypothetical protein